MAEQVELTMTVEDIPDYPTAKIIIAVYADAVDDAETLLTKTLGAYRNTTREVTSSRYISDAPPEIITLCGSTRFKTAFLAEQRRLTLEGKIVISVGLFGHDELPPGERERGNEIKDMLDELHLRKIDLADRVHVINVNGYVGESTRREIDYANETGVHVTYMEDAR